MPLLANSFEQVQANFALHNKLPDHPYLRELVYMHYHHNMLMKHADPYEWYSDSLSRSEVPTRWQAACAVLYDYPDMQASWSQVEHFAELTDLYCMHGLDPGLRNFGWPDHPGGLCHPTTWPIDARNCRVPLGPNLPFDPLPASRWAVHGTPYTAEQHPAAFTKEFRQERALAKSGPPAPWDVGQGDARS